MIQRFIIALGILASCLGSQALAHETDLNDRVTFYVTSLQQTQFQGEKALALTAVLDNGTRNRLTIRKMASDAGERVVLYSMREVFGMQTLTPRPTLAVRSGQGVEIAPPDFTIVITELSTNAQFRKPFTLDLTFNRAVGSLAVPVTFLLNDELEHGRGVIDIGPPAALVGDTPDYEWLTTDDLEGAASAQ